MSEHNGNGNGHREPTPAEKAWETAREEAREQGRSVRDDEIRCIKTKGLSCWAKILFWILSKICWESSPFLHDRRIGAVCITGRQLHTHFAFPQKRLYSQMKKTKDKAGKVVASRRVPGAIQELEMAGLVWMSHKRIENIPSNKWPNVFNLVRLVPRHVQPGLGLLEGVTVVDEGTATPVGSSDFFGQNGGGSGQTPQKGLGKHQRGVLAATNGGSGQPPLAGVGKNQRGELATTNGGSSPATNGGSSQEPTGGAAKPPRRELPTPASGTPYKTSGLKTDSLTKDGETDPPISKSEERELKRWTASLDKKFDKELLPIKTVLVKQRREADPTDTGLIYLLDHQLEAVQKRLYGPAAKAPKFPSPAPPKPKLIPVSDDQRKELAAKAAKELADYRRRERVIA